MPLIYISSVQNEDYKSFTELKNGKIKNNIPVYEFAYFTPEIIWEYGSTSLLFLIEPDTTTFQKKKPLGFLWEEKSRKIKTSL